MKMSQRTDHFNFFRLLFFTILLSLIATLSGCSSFYLDTSTPEIPAHEYKKPEQKVPVQLIFEFQTNGVFNSKATEYLKDQVFEQVNDSQLFESIETDPVASGSILSITLNNIAITDEAFSKGFVTGFTFGIVGSEVTDGYVCDATFISNKNPEKITARARHALHSVFGAKDAPDNAIKAKNINDAITTLTKQIVSHVLNEISNKIN